jgi:predicted RNase H-like HicB family nuclease
MAFAASGRRVMATLRQDTVKLTIHFEDAGDGWIVATIPEVPGAISQGRTRDEARGNVIDALRTVLTPDDQLAASPHRATTSCSR